MKKILALCFLLILSNQALSNSCSEQFEERIENLNNVRKVKALMYSAAFIFAFPVGLSGTSIEIANETNLAKQAKAYKVISEAYKGAGVNLEYFITKLNEKSQSEVSEEEAINFLISYDTDERVEGMKKFCHYPGYLPTRQLGFYTFKEMLKYAVKHFSVESES